MTQYLEGIQLCYRVTISQEEPLSTYWRKLNTLETLKFILSQIKTMKVCLSGISYVSGTCGGQHFGKEDLLRSFGLIHLTDEMPVFQE